jgi:hypothetical protein
MTLVTLTDAKTHLHITDPARDGEVAMMLAQATDAVLSYLKELVDETWTDTTAPPRVQRAVLLLTGLFWEDRDGHAARDHAADVWADIARLLERDRDPALA